MKNHIIIGMIITIILSCEEVKTIQKETMIDFGKDEYAVSSTATFDGGMVIGGTTTSIRDNQEMLFMKFDKDNRRLWAKTIGGHTIDKCYDVMELKDRSIVAIGSVEYSAFNTDMLVVKMNERGEVLWSRTFGGRNTDEGRALAQAEDGAIMALGTTLSFGAGGGDMFLVKIGQDGSLIWQRTIGQVYSDAGRDIQALANGGYIIAGNRSDGQTPYQASLTQITADGEEVWSKIYAAGPVSEARSVIVLPDGGFIFAGRARVSAVQGSSSTYAVRTNANGDVSWAQNYYTNKNNESSCIVAINDNAAVIGGFIDIRVRMTQAFSIAVNIEDGLEMGMNTYNDSTYSLGYSIVRRDEVFDLIGGAIPKGTAVGADKLNVVINRVKLPTDVLSK